MRAVATLAERTAAFLRGQSPCGLDRGLLAAVSGGPDSTALLLVLHHLQRAGALPGPLAVGHVDHAVHGDSDRIATSVRGLSERLGLACAMCRLPSWSRWPSEAALREARYAALARMAHAAGAAAVLTAHHRDDQVETICLRLGRRAGAVGLAGMQPCRPLDRAVVLLRPFLDVPRAQLADVVAEAAVETWSDPSNADRRYARARVRHVLAALREVAGTAADVALLALADGARERVARAQRWVAEHAQVGRGRLEIPLDHLARAGARGADAVGPGSSDDDVVDRLRCAHAHLSPATPPRRYWLQRAAALATASAAGATGKRLLGPVLAERTRTGLLLVDAAGAGAPPRQPLPLPLDGRPIAFGSTEWRVSAQRCTPPSSTAAAAGAGDRSRALVALDAAPLPWSVRSRRRGDRFHPPGMPGPVRLADLLAKRGVPRFDRDRVPLVVDARGRILWIAGVEVDGAARARALARSGDCVELHAEASRSTLEPR